MFVRGQFNRCFDPTYLFNYYGSLLSEKEKLQSDYQSLLSEKSKIQSDYNTLKSKHDKLVADTYDWVQLTDAQKAAQLAQAEADKIAAENAAKKAAEEKAAAQAQAKAEADKKAAEEAAIKAANEKKGYNTGITFDQLARNPDTYKGEKVKFTGEVLQVSEFDTEVQIRLATKANSWGGYSDDVIYIYFDESLISNRILEEDIITIYGVSKGLHSYTTVLGATVTLPLISVDKID
ncbi:MAG: toxin regulator [Eubacteriales bacterium]|nr:toxin regulator [Eubacteriales bacterium]